MRNEVGEQKMANSINNWMTGWNTCQFFKNLRNSLHEENVSSIPIHQSKPSDRISNEALCTLSRIVSVNTDSKLFYIFHDLLIHFVVLSLSLWSLPKLLVFNPKHQMAWRLFQPCTQKLLHRYCQCHRKQ